MTVKVDKEMRKRIEILKSYEKGARMNFTKKERVAKIDINDTGWIYTSPDGGKTLYREAVSPPHEDVSGVKLDRKSKLSLEEVFDDVQEVEKSLRKIKANIATLLQQAGG
tara:strand:+ start:71 stop:400 length:330 start_codon:yes stop_codon:yes gene_type:complete